MKMSKIVGLLVVMALFLTASLGIAQEEQEIDEKKTKKTFEGARPDLPGVLGLDLGFVWAPDLPTDRTFQLTCPQNSGRPFISVGTINGISGLGSLTFLFIQVYQ
jgi:hypothetical protein